MSAITDQLRRTRRAATEFGSAITTPRPRVQVTTAPWVPGWLLRLVLLGLGVASMITLAPPAPVVAVLAAFLLAALVRPGSRTGAFYCLVVGGAVVVFPPPPFSPASAALLALTTAVVALAPAVEHLPLSARIEWWALWPAARRYLIIQLISQPLVLGAVLVQRQAFATLGVAAGAALVVTLAIWLLLPRLSHRS